MSVCVATKIWIDLVNLSCGNGISYNGKMEERKKEEWGGKKEKREDNKEREREIERERERE